MRERSFSVRSALADRELELGPPDAVVQVRTHWRLSKNDDDIAWLILDRAGESTNTLSEEVIGELDTMLADIEGLSARALVIRSAKKNGFIAGADIRDFRGVTDAAEIEKRMSWAHGVIDRLAGMEIPTIAVIHGHCLGAGLELALACQYRIAIEGASLGFPEVMLGLHPGLGGTFRLIKEIDPIEAMTMMLTGKSAHARKAKRLGLVEAVVEERHVASAVEMAAARELKRSGPNWKNTAFRLTSARAFAGKRMRAEAKKRAPPEHYPAPYSLIGLWEEHGANDRALQKAEIASFSKLLAGQTAQNLIRVFFLRERLKGFGKGRSGVSHVHVIGAGAMGGDIAAWCASQGVAVSLTDLDPEAIAKAVGRASDFFDKKLHSPVKRRDAMDRLIPDIESNGLRRADIVIEAIAEDPEIKAKVYADITPKMKGDAILATNTSSIPLEALRGHIPFPERLVGMHFFNPVTRMQLVEIVSHDKADEKMLDRARAFCGDIDRLPAPVKSAPGFLVNRALTPYLMEAFIMLDEGVDKEVMDRAARDFGMPMGPIELADQVGLDIGLSVAESLKSSLSEPMPDIPKWLRDKVAKGELGRKSGQGIYDYDDDGKPKKSDNVSVPSRDMADRLVLPMVNACVKLLREGVVEDAETVDGAMIFATGFAPFRGGPIHYARQRGGDSIVSAMVELAKQHGPRFKPDDGWSKLAEY